MGRDLGPSCKVCRREGEKLFLKGHKCSTGKCSLEKKAYRPGQHGKLRRRESDYAIQLREKQKVRSLYGVREQQFRSYFKEADKSKGVTGEILLQLLERRLDNVVYRMKFSTSRAHARQLVNHGIIYVNGRRLDIVSYIVQQSDEISVFMPDAGIKKLKAKLEDIDEDRSIPGWITTDKDKLSGIVNRMPQREDIDYSVNEQLIVELYSK